MGKKILISKDNLDDFIQKDELDDISLKFTLSDSYHTLNIDLTPLINGNLERRKEIHKFKDFLIKCRHSLSTKNGYYKQFKQMVLTMGVDFNGDILERLHKYFIILLSRFEDKKISQEVYSSYRSTINVIFSECYGIQHKDFNKVFPTLQQRTGKIHNAMIIDANGDEKAFTKAQFREIGKIFLRLHELFENLLKDRPKNQYTIIFKYLDIYELNIDLHFRNNFYIQNRNTFCLLMGFICLTGINLSPAIRMKRSDINIDKDRKLITFQVTCNRKGKTQLHSYPMKDSQLKFFEKILSNSLSVSPEKDILFPFISNDLAILYFNHKISKYYEVFNKGFCGEYKNFTINARKLRHSFGSQFDDIDLRSIALFNSINTAAKNYSTGNAQENNEALQSAMNIYTIALSNSEDIQNVRQHIEKINVVEIQDISSLKQQNSQITSSGIFCVNSKEGIEPDKFKRRMEKLSLDNIESINCANILACFNCSHSVIVNNFENVYLLKSFYNYLNNVMQNSDTSSLFSDQNAVKSAIFSIKLILDSKIDKKTVKKVDKHISIHGNHPLWDIEENI